MKNVVAAIGLVDWEAQFVSGLSHPMLGLSLQRRCVDGVDVRAAVQVVSTDLVIVSDYTPRVDRDLMSELIDKDISVIAIGSDEEYWNDLGADYFIAIDLGNPLTALAKISETMRIKPIVVPQTSSPSGELIAVAGFGGGCGRSTLVKELSWLLSNTGKNVLMVDADTYGASLHQELGMAPNNLGLLEACRAMEKRTASDVEFSELVSVVTPNLSLLAGLPRSSRWTDLRIPALKTTWQRAISSYDYVIVDVGGVLEIDHSLLHESSLPRRHAASLTALATASSTFICARADSVGTARLVRGYLEFHELFAESNLSAVLWGTESDRDEREIAQAVTRHTGIQAISCIPLNWKAVRASLERGITISNLDQKCEVTRAYSKLATQITSASGQTLSIETKKRARSGFRSKRAA